MQNLDSATWSTRRRTVRLASRRVARCRSDVLDRRAHVWWWPSWRWWSLPGLRRHCPRTLLRAQHIQLGMTKKLKDYFSWIIDLHSSLPLSSPLHLAVSANDDNNSNAALRVLTFGSFDRKKKLNVDFIIFFGKKTFNKPDVHKIATGVASDNKVLTILSTRRRFLEPTWCLRWRFFIV